MIRQGILIFEEIPERMRLTGLRVAGLSLLERGIRTMARTGIERLSVVAPASAPLSLSRLTRKLDLTIEFLTWDSASLLAPTGGEGALVLLGDYVHHHSSLTALVEEGLKGNDLVVQASEAPAQDLPFCRIESEDPLAFSSERQPDSPVSTGAFLCSSGIFPLELASARIGFHEFLESRAADRATEVRIASPPLWRRALDRRSAREAKRMLFTQVTKATSGFVSRHLNARISIPISKILVETGLSPHLITVLLVLTTGLASAYLVSRPDTYLRQALAGILWQMAAILDRCDGEVARVKLCESKFGAWFDTVTDNIAYLCAYVGMLFGMNRLHPDEPLYWRLGLSAIAALLLTLLVMYTYARRSGSGSLQHYLRDLTRDLPESEKTWLQKSMQRYGFIAKRDFFSFFIFLSTLVNRLEIAYWFLIFVLHSAAFAVLLSQRKMLVNKAVERVRSESREQSASTSSGLSIGDRR